MKDIIVAGSVNMDIVTETDHHPRPGETVIGKNLHFIPGGKGANQAVAASRLGARVSFIGKVGKDGFGDTLSTFLKGEQLDLQGFAVSHEAPTGTALIVVDKGSENAIVVVPGSNGTLTVKDLDAVSMRESGIVLSQFEIPQSVIQELFTRAHAIGSVTVLNPAPAVPCPRELLALADYLIVNETELAFFSHHQIVSEDLETAAAQARRLRTHEGQAVIVTLGEKGAICLIEDELIEVSGHKVPAIDTTGAGDCFVGAFAVALSENMPIRASLQFANATAALSVQHLGASASLPHRSDVETFRTQSAGTSNSPIGG